MFTITITNKDCQCLDVVMINSHYYCEQYLLCRGYKKIKEDFYKKDELTATISKPREVYSIDVIDGKRCVNEND